MNSIRETYKNDYSKIALDNKVIEKVILKAEESCSPNKFTSNRAVRRNHRKILIVAFILLTLTATNAFAIPGAKEMLQKIFGSGANIVSSNMQNEIRVANDDYAISVGGIAKNDQTLWVVVSIQGLSDEAKKNLNVKNYYAIHADEILSAVDIVDKSKNADITLDSMISNHTWNTDTEKYILMRFDVANVKDGDTITIRFYEVGMELTFPIENSVDSIYFDTENIDYADGCSISKLSISPFTFYFEVKKSVENLSQHQVDEQYNIISNQLQKDWHTLTIVYKDGTRIGYTEDAAESDGTFASENGGVSGFVDVDGFFNITACYVFSNMIDVHNVDHIELNGVIYRVLEKTYN